MLNGLKYGSRQVVGRLMHSGGRSKSALAMAATIELSPSSLRLCLPGGADFQLNPFWLRERCQSSDMVDPSTKQPVYNPHDFRSCLTMTAASVLPESNELEVSFVDGHTSNFDLNRLEAELMNFSESPIQVDSYNRPKVKTWSGDTFAVPKYDATEVMEDQSVRLALITDLLTTGAALVSNVPRESGAVVRFGETLSTLRQTDWGPCFNVRTKPDAEQIGSGGAKKDLAYTPNPIGFHTDNPYRWPTPDFQLLHAIDHCTCPDAAPCAECSVLNYMVDGYYIAEKLRQEDPNAFELMSTVPVRFENNGGDGGSALVHVAPHFELGRFSDTLQAIRFSAKSGQYAPPMDPVKAAAFYEARRRFSEMAHDAKHINSMQFQPGDCLVFDNQRILHARSQIMPTDGERWVQGCYIDRDGLWLNYERFRRQLAA